MLADLDLPQALPPKMSEFMRPILSSAHLGHDLFAVDVPVDDHAPVHVMPAPPTGAREPERGKETLGAMKPLLPG